MLRFGFRGIRRYDLREQNGIRWWRVDFAPFDFLIDPGVWIKDTRVDAHAASDARGISFRRGAYRVVLLRPNFRFDHGRPTWWPWKRESSPARSDDRP